MHLERFQEELRLQGGRALPEALHAGAKELRPFARPQDNGGVRFVQGNPMVKVRGGPQGKILVVEDGARLGATCVDDDRIEAQSSEALRVKAEEMLNMGAVEGSQMFGRCGRSRHGGGGDGLGRVHGQYPSRNHPVPGAAGREMRAGLDGGGKMCH
jgi:hypothetical protein